MLPIDRRVNDRIPFFTFALILVNIAVFLVLWIEAGDLQGLQRLWLRYGAVPARPTLATLFTHMFLHGGIDHVSGNMLFLAFFGMNVERRLGPTLYSILYFLSGLSSVGLFILFSGRSEVPLIGASGAISGVTGMYLALYARRVVDVLWFFGTFKAPAFVFILFWVGLEILQGVVLGRAAVVAHWAHVGGFAGGWIVLCALLKAGFRGHAEVKPPEPKKLRDSFTELRYIPEPAGAAEELYGLIPRDYEPLPCAARDLDFRRAEDLQRELAEKGRKTVLLPERKRVRLPAMELLRMIDVDGRLTLHDELDRRVARDASLVYLIASGRVSGRIFLDLFVTSPWTDYRLSDATAAKALHETAVELRRRLGQCFFTPSFVDFSEGRTERVAAFDSQNDYDAYNLWYLQRLALGLR